MNLAGRHSDNNLKEQTTDSFTNSTPDSTQADPSADKTQSESWLKNRFQGRRDSKLARRQDSKVKAKADSKDDKTQSWLTDKIPKWKLTQKQIPRTTRLKVGSPTRLKGKADKTQSWNRQDSKLSMRHKARRRHKTDSSQLITPEDSTPPYKFKTTSSIWEQNEKRTKNSRARNTSA